MKAPYASSIAALTGLSLLVPAAYGLEFFICGNGARYPVDATVGFASFDPRTIQPDSDPSYSDGEIYGVYRFQDTVQGNTKRSFMMQSISRSPHFRLYEKVSSNWKICPIEDQDP
ncbi:BgTH12-07828 [Blumeria graminis f. sp. triticale]|uniref:BgtE-20031 n=3 Tax=Blumeria graminis TaxID=34373 RepID=A0A381KZ67_BLUGR|nr:BgTH12-07828 [Blumeria graminis f. sp. triticale]VDB96461.1 BgtE-20031 [Blumeria graminis f. sp. tritici]